MKIRISRLYCTTCPICKCSHHCVNIPSCLELPSFSKVIVLNVKQMDQKLIFKYDKRLLFAVGAGIVEQAKPLNLSAFLHYCFFRWGKERQAFHTVVLFFFSSDPLLFFSYSRCCVSSVSLALERMFHRCGVVPEGSARRSIGSWHKKCRYRRVKL